MRNSSLERRKEELYGMTLRKRPASGAEALVWWDRVKGQLDQDCLVSLMRLREAKDMRVCWSLRRYLTGTDGGRRDATFDGVSGVSKTAMAFSIVSRKSGSGVGSV